MEARSIAPSRQWMQPHWYALGRTGVVVAGTDMDWLFLDRELHFIAPKGRPVKQCDHCRGARKSKSHHAKCDCGGRKERGEVKREQFVLSKALHRV